MLMLVVGGCVPQLLVPFLFPAVAVVRIAPQRRQLDEAIDSPARTRVALRV